MFAFLMFLYECREDTTRRQMQKTGKWRQHIKPFGPHADNRLAKTRPPKEKDSTQEGIVRRLFYNGLNKHFVKGLKYLIGILAPPAKRWLKTHRLFPAEGWLKSPAHGWLKVPFATPALCWLRRWHPLALQRHSDFNAWGRRA